MVEKSTENTSIEDNSIDQLTGFYNISSFTDVAHEHILANPKSSFDCLAAYVANMDKLNSSEGRAVGDAVLSGIGNVLKEALPNAVGARLADKFFFIIDTKDRPTEVETLAILNKVRQITAGKDAYVQFADYRNFNKNLSTSTVCDRALLALSNIKDERTIWYIRYTDKLNQVKNREHVLESHFDRAISEGQFFPVLQPKFDAKHGRVVGAEALARWKDEHEMIFPIEFIPLFEKDGHITEIDEVIFRKVCQYQKDRDDRGLTPLPISVNISKRTILMKDAAFKYKSIVEEIGIPVELVPIELTAVFASGDEMTVDAINRFIGEGFEIHIDELSTKLTFFAHLDKIPITMVKMDKRIMDTFIGDSGKVIIKHIIQMAHELGIPIVAEGVEYQEQVDFLRRNKCDAIQGYYFSKPVLIEEYEEMSIHGLKK